MKLKQRMIEGESYDKQISFFEKLVERMKNNQLSSDEKKRYSEFYMSEKLIEYIQHNQRDFQSDENKWLKYFTLGWYIYEQIGIQND